jgi:YesN/AraC family two-component response regulator
MVIDDEQWVRKSISRMIDELALGIEVVAEARHGEEALEMILIHKPDIVLTDMSMPIMSGQQFMKHLYTHHKEIKVIVISGFSNFEYLKSAISYQAYDYILKPVSVTDLKNALSKAIADFNKERQNDYHRHLSLTARKLKREEFLQHVANHRISNRSDIAKQAEELQIARPFGQYRLVAMAYRRFTQMAEAKFKGNVDLLMFSLENILCDVIEDDELLIFKSDDKMRLFLLLPAEKYGLSEIRAVLSKYHDSVQSLLNLDVLAGVSRVFGGLTELQAASKEAMDMVGQNPFGAGGLCVRMYGETAKSLDVEWITSFDLKKIKQALAVKSEPDIVRFLASLTERIGMSKEISIHDINREFRKLVIAIADGMKENSLINPYEHHVMEWMTGPEDAAAFIEKIKEQIEYGFRHSGGAGLGNVMEEIIAFLKEHYFEDLSLVDVATRFHFDPTYFSKLFKAFNKESFIEYMTRLRIEKACDLLSNSNMKIHEIAELVGYENQRYFSQVFKKVTGYTPSDYREHMEGKNGAQNFEHHSHN